ncbi:MAG: alpha/beta fold hydrolase [Planctomycetaceae bacterium]
MSASLSQHLLKAPLDRDPFVPPWLFRNGHVQTLAGMYVYAPRAEARSADAIPPNLGEVLLSDGDRLVYHEERPADWKPGDRVALLLHGLAGSHASPYMSRIARLLHRKSVRTFRLDWRGCGAGTALARYPYHSGRSEDVAAVIAEINRLCPHSQISVIGFSLGGNVTLKLLGENRGRSVGIDRIDRAVAICPPIDLAGTVHALRNGLGPLYDRYFCRACVRDVLRRQKLCPDAVVPDGWLSVRPRTLYEFDDRFTAPVCGFASASDYYARSSANQFLSKITIPTLVIAAQDDPVIPFRQFEIADFSSTTQLRAPRHGGHLGFCTPRGVGWMDRQVVEWAVG